MRFIGFIIIIMSIGVVSIGAEQSQTQLTIYNQNFALIKETRNLDLVAGENEVRVTDITAHLEPDSVILRDVNKPDAIRILEQNYESDPLSQGLLLKKSEGKNLIFEVQLPQSEKKKYISGKVLRSAYVPHTTYFQQYGQQYANRQMAYANSSGAGVPIIEVDGKIRFGLPGTPLFEGLDPATILKPTLLWRLWSENGGKHATEFSYLTGGMRWEATYNAVAPEQGDRFDITGWVTIQNVSGKDFENSSVKLMAGDVARVQDQELYRGLGGGSRIYNESSELPSVTERSFEEYHLYVVERPTTILDREVKQLEFVRAADVPAKRVYVYDGLKVSSNHRNWSTHSIRQEPLYGTESSKKVWTMLEFKNSKAAGLGIPLPKGTVKIYRQDIDNRNEFVGEDAIDHTPEDELVRLYTGNAFDIAGERTQTDFKLDNNKDEIYESFEIKLRNHKKEPVDVRVVEHLYRWLQWDITEHSDDFSKPDARTIEYRVNIQPKEEKVITYTAHYTW